MIESKPQYKWSEFGISFNANHANNQGEVLTISPKCSHNRSEKNKKQKCLAVNIFKLTWHCNHEPDCGWSGGLRGGERGNKYSARQYSKPEYKHSDLSQDHWDYLVGERCLSPEVLKNNKLSTAGGAIQFPFMRGEEVVNIKYRTPSKKMWMETGAERIVYGYNNLEYAKEEGLSIIVVEGEIDKLSVETAGSENPCISVPNGANSANVFRKLEGQLPNHVILAVDNDGQGKKLEDELAHSIGRKFCSRVSWPDGCKDANDVLVKRGRDTLRFLVDNPKPYPIAGIYDVESVEDEIIELYNNGIVGGEKIGWPSLDELYTVKTGYWTLVTGVPSSGKSGLVDHMAIRLAEKGWGFAVCSPENQPVHLHYINLLEKYTGKPFFKGSHRRMSMEEAMRGMEFLHEHFHMILPEPKGDGEQSLKLDSILEDVKICIFRYPNLKGVIIDPYNELDHSRRMGVSDSEFISSWISTVRRFARQYNVHIWVVAHPRKMEAEIGKDYPVVRPYDIEASRHWWSKGDCILSVWRSLKPDADTSVAVLVLKVKPRYIGRQGKALLDYDKVSSRYIDPLNGESNWLDTEDRKT